MSELKRTTEQIREAVRIADWDEPKSVDILMTEARRTLARYRMERDIREALAEIIPQPGQSAP